MIVNNALVLEFDLEIYSNYFIQKYNKEINISNSLEYVQSHLHRKNSSNILNDREKLCIHRLKINAFERQILFHCYVLALHD